MFITFEGIDGCGKTTQIKNLVEFLNEKKVSYVATREPGGTEDTELIRRLILRDGSKLDETSQMMLFFAARRENTLKVIKPNLRKGNVVISDRYYDSSYVYQVYASGMNETYFNELKKISEVVEPDLTFIFDIDPSITMERITDDGRYEKKGLDFYEGARQGYKQVSNKFPDRCIMVNAERSMEDIRSDVLRIVHEELRKKKKL